MVHKQMLAEQLRALIADEPLLLPNLANMSAFIYQVFDRLNWAGFYLVRENELILGPFQGKPACIRISKGKGVCGTAWEKDETLVVPDVHAFPGHIACDGASASEIVIPIHANGRVVGVLDIDSPVKGRFKETEQTCLETLVRVLESQNGLWDSIVM